MHPAHDIERGRGSKCDHANSPRRRHAKYRTGHGVRVAGRTRVAQSSAVLASSLGTVSRVPSPLGLRRLRLPALFAGARDRSSGRARVIPALLAGGQSSEHPVTQTRQRHPCPRRRRTSHGTLSPRSASVTPAPPRENGIARSRSPSVHESRLDPGTCGCRECPVATYPRGAGNHRFARSRRRRAMTNRHPRLGSARTALAGRVDPRQSRSDLPQTSAASWVATVAA